MKPYQVHDAVKTYLQTNWTTTSIREPGKDQKPSLPYVEPYFVPGMVSALEIGGAAERVGIFKINVFTKLGAGTKEGEVYGGMIEDLFHHHNINSLYFENGDVMPRTEWIGVDKALQANHHQVTIPFSVIWEN